MWAFTQTVTYRYIAPILYNKTAPSLMALKMLNIQFVEKN